MNEFRLRLQGLLVVIAISIGATACEADRHWTEEALLHDGRTTEVQRTVSFHMGGGELSQAFTEWPDQYKLSATNPNTRKNVDWHGERNFNPILIDFLGSNAYLVFVQNGISANLKQYGCPEIPYVFLRQREGERTWTQIAASEVPPRMLNANLSFSYEWTQGRLTKDEVERINKASENATSNHMTRAIPINFSTWKSTHKNAYRVGHYRDGCREVVPSNVDPSHPQSIGQPSVLGSLETIASVTHSPERVIESDSGGTGPDWRTISWDNELAMKCNGFVKRVGDESDRPELRGWLLFTHDATGQKKARDTSQIFCDDSSLWFSDYVAERNRVVLTKFALNGDFVYRLSVAKPEVAGDFPGFVLQPTFRSEAGYLYFEWWNARQSGRQWLVKRAMKVRLREPSSAVTLPPVSGVGPSVPSGTIPVVDTRFAIVTHRNGKT